MYARTAVIVVTAAALIVGVSACGDGQFTLPRTGAIGTGNTGSMKSTSQVDSTVGGSTGFLPPPSPAPAATTSGTEIKHYSDDTTSSATAPLKEIPVNGSFTDPPIGEELKLIGVVRSFPVPRQYHNQFSDAELLLVHLTITASSSYYVTIAPTSLYLTPTNGVKRFESTFIVTTEMNEAGYRVLPSDGPKYGQTLNGWVAFKAQEKASRTLILHFDRPKTWVLGIDAQMI